MSQDNPAAMNQNDPAARKVINDLIERFNYYSDENHRVSLNDLRGNTLNEKLADLTLRISQMPMKKSGGGGSGRPKLGMNLLMNIGKMRRDIKRVSKAMSPDGAQEIITKHNKGKPETSHWKLIHEDVDGDNIPDIFITNNKGHPLYYNGYTTTKSDWPSRYHYFKDYPTPESRRDKSMNQYVNELYGIKYNEPENVEDMHELGVRVSGSRPEAFENYDMRGYKEPSAREKLSGYSRFQKYVVKRFTDNVIKELEDNHILHIEPKYKIRLIAKASAILWKHLILANIAERHECDVDSKQFADAKKKLSVEINDEVSDLLNHLNFTHGDEWKEEDREDLNQRVGDLFASALMTAAGQMHVGRSDEYNGEFQHVTQPNVYRAHGAFVDEGHRWEHDTDFRPVNTNNNNDDDDYEFEG